mmetsp:Transcript_19806/g.28031  ORF Transcript_19806/g.28031 Transcript_19806/m.28031 type:complete len:145 (-) Transcript_19806:315-749(-)
MTRPRVTECPSQKFHLLMTMTVPMKFQDSDHVSFLLFLRSYQRNISFFPLPLAFFPLPLAFFPLTLAFFPLPLPFPLVGTGDSEENGDTEGDKEGMLDDEGDEEMEGAVGGTVSLSTPQSISCINPLCCGGKLDPPLVTTWIEC